IAGAFRARPGRRGTSRTPPAKVNVRQRLPSSRKGGARRSAALLIFSAFLDVLNRQPATERTRRIPRPVVASDADACAATAARLVLTKTIQATSATPSRYADGSAFLPNVSGGEQSRLDHGLRWSNASKNRAIPRSGAASNNLQDNNLHDDNRAVRTGLRKRA